MENNNENNIEQIKVEQNENSFWNFAIFIIQQNDESALGKTSGRTLIGLIPLQTSSNLFYKRKRTVFKMPTSQILVAVP